MKFLFLILLVFSSVQAEDFDIYPNGQARWMKLNEPLTVILFDQEVPLKGSMTFYEDGGMKRIFLASPIRLETPALKIVIREDYLELHDDGSLKSAYLQVFSKFLLNGKWIEIEHFPSYATYSNSPQPIEFYPNGTVRRGYLNRPTEVEILGQHAQIKDEIRFYQNGQLAQVTLTRPINISVLGQIVSAERNLEFDENGQLTSIILSKKTKFLRDGKVIKHIGYLKL